MKYFNVYLIAGATCLLASCLDSGLDCGACFTPPEEIRLKITDTNTGSDLVYTGYYHPDSIKIYYASGRSMSEVEVLFAFDSVNETGVLYSFELPWKSVDGVTDFFLQLNATDTDTIFLDVQEKTEDCCTFFVQHSFRINEEEMHLGDDYFYNLQKEIEEP